MKKILIYTLGFVFATTLPAWATLPDARDSIILESKVLAPGADAGPTSDTSAYAYLKVWITNKDSLVALYVALQERSISGGAYMTLAWPRNFNGVVSMLTSTLNASKIFNGARYHSKSPDSFYVAGVFDPLDPSTIEAPNAVRKAFWEIKFDTAVAFNIGIVEFDTALVLQTTGFTNTQPADVPVNFVKSRNVITGKTYVRLAEPLDGEIVTNPIPKYSWQLIAPDCRAPLKIWAGIIV